MIRTAGRILKSEDVKLEGQYRLDAPQGGIAGASIKPPAASSVPAKACVLESHADHVLIEITCSCGTKMVLKCDYAGAQKPGDSQTQNGADEASGQTK